MMELEYW